MSTLSTWLVVVRPAGGLRAFGFEVVAETGGDAQRIARDWHPGATVDHANYLGPAEDEAEQKAAS